MAGDIAELTARYRSDGFAVARGLFDAALLSEVTGEVERVVAAAAAAGEHVQVYFDAEAPGSPVRCQPLPPTAIAGFGAELPRASRHHSVDRNSRMWRWRIPLWLAPMTGSMETTSFG